MWRSVIFFFLFLTAAQICFAQIYSWVDENGVRHFSDTPTTRSPEMKVEAMTGGSGQGGEAADIPSDRKDVMFTIKPEDLDEKARQFAADINQSLVSRLSLGEGKRYFSRIAKSIRDGGLSQYTFSSGILKTVGTKDSITMNITITLELLNYDVPKEKNPCEISLCHLRFTKGNRCFDPPKAGSVLSGLVNSETGYWRNPRANKCSSTHL